MFEQLQVPRWGTEVEWEEFERLRGLYDGEARANRPPAPPDS
jgi:hypothetical protein